MTNYGDTPHVIYGSQEDYQALFQSDYEKALTVPVQLMAGYGKLPAGTIVAKNLSAAGKTGYYLPYNPTSFTGAENHPGRAYLVANSGTADQYVYVSMDDSYKFNVGDDIVINDNITAAENLGAITAIDRTTYQHMAKITFTTAIGGTAFLTSRFAYIAVEAGNSSNNYSDAVGVLIKAVDTGEGQYAKGAYAQILVSNAILYTGVLFLNDAAAKTDLSFTEFGNLAVFK